MLDLTNFFLKDVYIQDIESLEVLEGMKMWHLRSVTGEDFSTEAFNALQEYSNNGSIITIKVNNFTYSGQVLHLGSKNMFYILKEHEIE